MKSGKPTIWNKFIQSLLFAGERDSVLLALMLVDDVIDVCHWRYMGPSSCKKLKLPTIEDKYPLAANLMRLIDQYYRKQYKQAFIEDNNFLALKRKME